MIGAAPNRRWALIVIPTSNSRALRVGKTIKAIRHLCLNRFEQEPSKLRLAQKRRKAAPD